MNLLDDKVDLEWYLARAGEENARIAASIARRDRKEQARLERAALRMAFNELLRAANEFEARAVDLRLAVSQLQGTRDDPKAKTVARRNITRSLNRLRSVAPNYQAMLWDGLVWPK